MTSNNQIKLKKETKLVKSVSATELGANDVDNNTIMNKINPKNSSLFFLALLTIFSFYTGCKNEYQTIKAKKTDAVVSSNSNNQNFEEITNPTKPYYTSLYDRDSVIIKKTENASVNFRNAITFQDSDWYRSYYLGQTFMFQEKYTEALAHLKTALVNVDNSVNNRYKIYFSLGECYENLGDDKQAFLAFYTASNIKPDSKEALQGVQRHRQSAQLK